MPTTVSRSVTPERYRIDELTKFLARESIHPGRVCVPDIGRRWGAPAQTTTG